MTVPPLPPKVRTPASKPDSKGEGPGGHPFTVATLLRDVRPPSARRSLRFGGGPGAWTFTGGTMPQIIAGGSGLGTVAAGSGLGTVAGGSGLGTVTGGLVRGAGTGLTGLRRRIGSLVSGATTTHPGTVL